MNYGNVQPYSTLMANFGEWLRSARKKKGYSYRTLADRAGNVCSFGYIKQLEDQLTSKDGRLYKPGVEIVDALAAALGQDVDEARLAAGYAPRSLTSGKPQTLDELLSILERAGVSHVEFADADSYRNAPPEVLQEVLDSVAVAVSVALSRLKRKEVALPDAPRSSNADSGGTD